MRLGLHVWKVVAVFTLIGLAFALTPLNWFGDIRLFGSNTPYLWLGALPSVFFGFALVCVYRFGDWKIFAVPQVA